MPKFKVGDVICMPHSRKTKFKILSVGKFSYFARYESENHPLVECTISFTPEDCYELAPKEFKVGDHVRLTLEYFLVHRTETGFLAIRSDSSDNRTIYVSDEYLQENGKHVDK